MTTIHERHMINYPASTISAEELDLLNHIGRWGSAAYPIKKVGRSKWVIEKMWGAGGFPTVFARKSFAVERFELYMSLLRDKAAGREPGTGDR